MEFFTILKNEWIKLLIQNYKLLIQFVAFIYIHLFLYIYIDT